MKANEEAQLMLQAYALIASTEFIDDQIWLPEQLTEDKFNQISSGLFALIYENQNPIPIWQSKSALNEKNIDQWKPKSLSSGKRYFGELSDFEKPLSYLQYSVIWETESQTEKALQFIIFNDQSTLDKQISAYRASLWFWLVAIAIVITLTQLLILKWGLRPIQEVADDIKAIQNNSESRLNGRYPSELKVMTDSINTLLDTESAQRSRYKESLSDLAHSLKTPLAIMQGCLYELNQHTISENDNKLVNDTMAKNEAEKELSEQINRINQIINYQLKRSVNVPSNAFSNLVKIRPQCEKILSALNKVYREQAMQVDMDIPPELSFKGDKDDLLEVLGNLLDNAYKYGKDHILIKADNFNDHLKITIEDNGSGIPEQHQEKILERGQRADTTKSGQGIGLAVVTDIISHYNGSLKFDTSSLGGLAIIIEFQSIK